MLLLKDKTVKYDGLACEMYFALGVAASLKHRMYGNAACVVTSLLDGTHNADSLHPKGLAADLRTHDLTDIQAIAWFEAIKAQLEPVGFDVVWEGGVGATPATTGAHVHVEFQLKEGESFWHYAK